MQELTTTLGDVGTDSSPPEVFIKSTGESLRPGWRSSCRQWQGQAGILTEKQPCEAMTS